MDADKVAMFCGDSYQCKYDYSTTLNKEFAQFTKYYQDQFVNIYEGVLKPDAMVPNSDKSWYARYFIHFSFRLFRVANFPRLGMEESQPLHSLPAQWSSLTVILATGWWGREGGGVMTQGTGIGRNWGMLLVFVSRSSQIVQLANASCIPK